MWGNAVHRSLEPCMARDGSGGDHLRYLKLRVCSSAHAFFFSAEAKRFNRAIKRRISRFNLAPTMYRGKMRRGTAETFAGLRKLFRVPAMKKLIDRGGKKREKFERRRSRSARKSSSRDSQRRRR